MNDPYSVLGVPHDATDEEIKAAYRRLAKMYHPDLHPGDEEAAKKMNEINAAYEQIKNPPQQGSGGYYSSGDYGGSCAGYGGSGGGGNGTGGGRSAGGSLRLERSVDGESPAETDFSVCYPLYRHHQPYPRACRIHTAPRNRE